MKGEFKKEIVAAVAIYTFQLHPISICILSVCIYSVSLYTMASFYILLIHFLFYINSHKLFN